MDIIDAIVKLKAIVNTSLHYSKDAYDIERLNEMKDILIQLTSKYSTGFSEEDIQFYFNSDSGYVTPKVDIRAVVFNHEDKLLLVQEKSDGTWALPGGWADVGYSPSEIARKETFEEAGLDVTPVRLMKVVDKAKHSYPKSMDYVYKLIFYCTLNSYETKVGIETSDVLFFSLEEVMKLENISVERNTITDLMDAFTFHENPQTETKFD